MSAGIVNGKVVLDHPRKHNCGSTEPVTGHIALTYMAPASHVSQQPNSTGGLQELFGPLKIFVRLNGRTKTKVHKSNGNHSSTYRGRAPLFAQQQKIHDGPYTSKSGECVRFPFSFNFPAASQDMPGRGEFREDARFHSVPGGPLPPTFVASNTGFSKSFVAFVEYRISAEIRMPGIKISVRGLDSDQNSPAVLYEQPRLPISDTLSFKRQQFAHSIRLQNELLLPEEDRPTGFRQKTKFKFSSERYPEYNFSVYTTAPSEVHIGQPLVFELTILPDQKACTAPIPPEIKVHYFRAEVRSLINIRSEYGFLSHEECSKDFTLPALTMRSRDLDVPFGKANDYTKFIHTSGVPAFACSSFSTYNICQRYALEIQFSIQAAGKTKVLKRRVPITVHPPMEDGAYASGQAEASSSSAPPELLDSKSALEPAADLPEYERPPEYDQVLEMGTEDDVPEASAAGKGKAVAL